MGSRNNVKIKLKGEDVAYREEYMKVENNCHRIASLYIK
jgi:hypothetical protein